MTAHEHLIDLHLAEMPARPSIATQRTAAHPVRDFGAIWLDDVEIDGGPEWLVRQLLTASSMSALWGDPGCGKSFLATFLAVCIATGQEFLGMNTIRGGVIYIAAEGGRGIKKRLVAIRQRFGLPPGVPFVLIPTSVDLCTDDHETEALIAEVHRVSRAMDCPLRLVKDIRSNIGDRGPRTSDVNPMRPIPADASARGVDDGYGSYSGEIAEASTSLRSNESFTDWAVRNRRGDLSDYRGLTTGHFLRAMICGPSNDMEKRALSEGTDSAGGYTVPDVLSARLIDKMRSASVVMKAGAQTIPLGSDVNYVAKLLTDPVPAWRAENAAIAESDPTFGRVTLTARSLGVIVKVSRELLEDSLNIGTALPNIIATAMAAELDRVALLGSGTPPEPKGVANFSGLTSNTFAGGALTGYQDLMLARRALNGANVTMNGFIMHSRDESAIVETLDGNGQPVLPPPVLETMPMWITNKIPTNGGVGTNESSIFAGDWSKLMIGIRHQLRIEVLKERYADTNAYGLVAVLRADVAAEHEAAFTVLEGITP